MTGTSGVDDARPQCRRPLARHPHPRPTPGPASPQRPGVPGRTSPNRKAGPVATTYGFLSTHPPTYCGLATFNAALATAITAGSSSGGVVRVTTGAAAGPPGRDVRHTWPAHDPNGWRDAADALNGFDVAIVQHEYGIYPGADGADVLRLMRRLRVPAIVVLHTVLSRPTPRQKSVLEQVAGAAGAVVTMTATAHDRLIVGYDVDPAKVSTIPHGTGDHTGTPAVRGPRPHLLTWGLLGPGKGI